MSDCGAFFAGAWHRLRQAELYAAPPPPGNPGWEEADLRVLVLRLSPYRDVDRSTPHLFLARAVRAAVPAAYLDFFFFPPEPDRRLLEASGVPLVTGLASRRSMEDFDLLLASCSYHLELVNLYHLLRQAGLPLRASAREAFPLLLVGGSSAMAAQGLLFPDGDCLADGLFFGEGEGQVQELVRLLAGSRGRPRRARLEQAAAVRGFWPAGDLGREAAQAVHSPGEQPPPWPSLSGEQAATARLELSYGCPFRCSFCFEGWERRPYRPLPVEELLESARRLKLATGAHTLELASFNVNTHPDLPRLLLETNRRFAQVNFMSQRADILNDTPGLLELELAAGKRSYTLGVEGLSARLRAFLSKRLGEAPVRELLERLVAGGAREVKLFYLLTGYEQAEDFAEFRAFLGWLRGRKGERGPRLVFSFNRLVRMPFTPLAHDRLFLEEDRWEPLLREARAAVEAVGEFRLAASWAEYAVSQVLALGGTWLHEPLAAMAAAGLCYDRELPAAAWRLLSGWLREHPREAGLLAAEKPADHPFPLAFVRTPMPAALRYAQYLRCRECLARGRPEAGRPEAGGPEPGGPERAPGETPAPRLAAGAPAAMAELMRRKARLKPVLCELEVPPEAAGGSPEWLEARMLAGILQRHPALLDNLLSVRETLFAGRSPRDRFPPWHGRTLFALTAWEPEAVTAALQARALPPAASVDWLRLRLELPGGFFPRAGERLAEYLESEHAPVTARRGAAGLVLEPGPRALKRRVLLAGVVRAAGGREEGRPDSAEGALAELTVGPRFRLRRYLDLFAEPEAWRRARVQVLELGWNGR